MLLTHADMWTILLTCTCIDLFTCVCMYGQSMNHNFLKKGRCYAKSPTAQASSAWGDLETGLLSHEQNSVRWLALAGRSSLNIASLCAAASLVLHPELQRKGLGLVWRVGGGLGLRLLCHVFVNVFVHACRSTYQRY